MSLFEKAGRRFEKTKRAVVGGEASYVCRTCEARLQTASEFCPQCGEATVEEAD